MYPLTTSSSEDTRASSPWVICPSTATWTWDAVTFALVMVDR
jgi:hypothetical protein